MTDERRNSVIGVRFCKVGKIYHFDPGEIKDILVGDPVIVETSRGWQLGFVAGIFQGTAKSSENLRTIQRKANPRDLIVHQMWQQKVGEVLEFCRNRAAELRIRGTKIVDAEYSFDGERLTVFYSIETEDKVDLKSMRKDVQKRYPSAKLEFRPVGPRDVAKMMGGMGACNIEKRCCCAFLTDFSSISIRMAKNQGISLTPSEITGICGRLRCCLLYENELYEQALVGLPKKNKRVKTPFGEGRVVEVRALSEEVVIDIKDTGKKVFTKSDFQKIESDS